MMRGVDPGFPFWKSSTRRSNAAPLNWRNEGGCAERPFWRCDRGDRNCRHFGLAWHVQVLTQLYLPAPFAFLGP